MDPTVKLQTTRWRLGLSPIAEVSMAALTKKAASEALKTRSGQPSGPPSQGTLDSGEEKDREAGSSVIVRSMAQKILLGELLETKQGEDGCQCLV